MAETKRCPYCGEEILAVAKKCKHCGEWLDDSTRPDNINVAQDKADTKKGETLKASSIQSTKPMKSSKSLTKKVLGVAKWVLIGIVSFILVLIIIFVVSNWRILTHSTTYHPSSTINYTDSATVEVEVEEVPEYDFSDEHVGSSNGDDRTSGGAYIDFLESEGQ